MVRKIVLEDDSFMEEEIVDDCEVLHEIRNASWPRGYDLHAREPEAFDEDQSWRNRIRSREPPRN
jgi:hypothetical protein